MTKTAENVHAILDRADHLRRFGKSEGAISLYSDALALLDRSTSEDAFVAIHHLWGEALLDLGRSSEAREHFRIATGQAVPRENGRWAAIDRSESRAHLIERNLSYAMNCIERSLSYIPRSEIAERGASLGIKARILYARGDFTEGLELFGTADGLLQRGGNPYYELENLLEYIAALTIELTTGTDGLEWYLDALTRRARRRAGIFGGPTHQERATRQRLTIDEALHRVG